VQIKADIFVKFKTKTKTIWNIHCGNDPQSLTAYSKNSKRRTMLSHFPTCIDLTLSENKEDLMMGEQATTIRVLLKNTVTLSCPSTPTTTEVRAAIPDAAVTDKKPSATSIHNIGPAKKKKRTVKDIFERNEGEQATPSPSSAFKRAKFENENAPKRTLAKTGPGRSVSISPATTGAVSRDGESDHESESEMPHTNTNNAKKVHDDDEELEMLGTVGQNALLDFPHSRENCAVHKFNVAISSIQKEKSHHCDNTSHMNPNSNHKFCTNCYCYVCNELASRCKSWKEHCGASHSEASWRRERSSAKKWYGTGDNSTNSKSSP
jgi:hypothetical protein